MFKVVIVDDEMIMRATLRSLINWEELGFEIAADAANGERALQYLSRNKADLLITDMKMPIMNGLELIRRLKETGDAPVILVLSGYNDFELVREAFRIGAHDYILKEDINEITLSNVIKNILKLLQEQSIGHMHAAVRSAADGTDKRRQLADMLLGKRDADESFFSENYVLSQFEIDDFSRHVKRFGNDLENDLITPMLNFAAQIPRVASRCVITDIAPSKYALYYEINGNYNSIESICRQLTNTWKNYMNISVSAGISSIGSGKDDLGRCFAETEKILTLKYIYGKNHMFMYGDSSLIDVGEAEASKEKYWKLRDCFYSSDENMIGILHGEFFMDIWNKTLAEAKKECLYIIYQTAVILKDINVDIRNVFNEDTNYKEKIDRLDTFKVLEIWVINFLRWVMDYMRNNYNHNADNIIDKAKHFIWDNCANSGMSLKVAADYIGLSEKYFSSRFAKETGSTFSNYLTDIRMRKAKDFLRKTDMKIYEVAEKVGYNAVEHFDRVFRKTYNVSPTEYKRSVERN